MSLLHQHCHKEVLTAHSCLSHSSVTMKITLEYHVSLHYRCYNSDPTRSTGINSDKVFMMNLFQICEKVLSNRFHSRHKNMPRTHTEENWKRGGGASLEISSWKLFTWAAERKGACLHQLQVLHQNCPIHTHTRHPKFTNYNTDHKAEGNVVKHDGDIFPTFTLFSDIAWLHLGGNRNSQNIRFTCRPTKCH